MTVAILYICTGKYSIFWNDFYQSCEQYFLPAAKKKYFIFSDTLSQSDCDYNAEIIFQQKMGWPNDTLMRYHLFALIEEKLKQFDYIFFCNANTIFRQAIPFDVFKTNGSDPELIVVRHPFFHWVKRPDEYPYERNHKSTACIKKGLGTYYVMGGFNGGQSVSFIKLIHSIKKNIDKDKSKGILARWHDESHLNKYISEVDAEVKYLDYNFGFPEGHELPLSDDVFIEFTDKVKKGGHDFLRGKENSIPVQPVPKTNFLRRIRNKFF